MSSIMEINEANFEAKVTKSSKPFVLDFWSEGCAPCKFLHGIIEEILPSVGEKIDFGSVNVMENFGLAGQFGIMGTPTLILFKDGKVAWQQVGALPKDKLMSKLEPYMN